MINGISFIFASLTMLIGGNLRFRKAIFIGFTFVQLFFKFYKKSDNQKLKAGSSLLNNSQ